LSGHSIAPAVSTPFARRNAETETDLIDTRLEVERAKKVKAFGPSLLHFFIRKQSKIDIFDTREPGRVNPISREVNNSFFIARFERPDQYSPDNLVHSIYGDNKRGFVAHLTPLTQRGGRYDKRETDKK
jgi:hypothetical protein